MESNLFDRLLITLAVPLRSFSVCRIQRGWRLGFPPFDAITIHYVLQGTGSLQVGQAPWRSFAPHTVIIVPARQAHVLGQAEDPIGEARAEDHCALHSAGLISFTAGDGSADALFVCGQIADSHTGAMGLFELFQTSIIEAFPPNDAMQRSFELMLEEVNRPGLGTQAMTEVLMKQCLIILLRRHLQANNADSPLLMALGHPKIARVVLTIMERPGDPYTVESLAAFSGMGRTSFADAFSELFGQGPMAFVQRLRLKIAAQFLNSTDMPIKVVASSVGYASRSSFSNAFNAQFGASPSEYRAAGRRSDINFAASEFKVSNLSKPDR